MSTRAYSLVVRGPIVKSMRHLLTRSVYDQIMKKGVKMLRKGTDSGQVVEAVMDMFVEASMHQKHEGDGYPEEIMGPWNGFAAIALDLDGNLDMAHRKHPNKPDKDDLVEQYGMAKSEGGCVSIAAPHLYAHETATYLAETPDPAVMCFHLVGVRQDIPLGGIVMTTEGQIGVATKNGLMEWAAMKNARTIDYGFKENRCKDYE